VFIHSIDHVNIRAPGADVVKLRQFYCEVMGLQEGWRPPFESRGFWLYAGPHPLVHLVEGNSDRAAGGGIDHVAFRCADLANGMAHLRARGLEFRVMQVPTLGQRQILLRDPLGTGVEITAAGPAE
jgi:catechol 2,3-dioxygenase-like lactoylglutathione lyase family enzyme